MTDLATPRKARNIPHALLSGFISILVFLALALGAVRLVLNPWFVEFEYRTPDFPADPYGFTQEERLKYSKIAIEYLLNDAGIEFLAEQRFPDGQAVPAESCVQMEDCSYMYNGRELKHMLDVKIVLQKVLGVWMGALLLLAGLGLGAWRGGWLGDYWRAWRWGGWLVLGLVGIILLAVLLLFGTFFIFFHNVFFESGTWMFLFSDTLIRLFPQRFWRDTFLTVATLAAVMGALVALPAFIARRKARKPG